MQQTRSKVTIHTAIPAAWLAMSLSVFAQTPQTAAPPTTSGTIQTGSQQSAPTTTEAAHSVPATGLTAEFTKGIDTKKANTGDEVNAKTTADAKLPDGTELPKGTKLLGNVVEVTAKSKERKNSHLVISLNRAVTKDGKDLPIHAAVTSVTAPAMPQSMDMPSPGGGGMAPSGGGDSSGSGGSASAPMPSASPSVPTAGGDSTMQQGAMLKSAQDHVPVGNMPNVLLSAPTTPNSAGILDAQNQNISISSGTKFTVNIMPAPAQGGQ
jgi:hypothetical protein